jgi:hypothetical protein
MDGRRLDMIEATKHDLYAQADYRRLMSIGIRTCRDGLRWHRIEQRPGVYDFSSAMPMVSAAQDAGMQVIWDLFHYGWPDFLDLFSIDFPRRYRDFAVAAARFIRAHTAGAPYFCPINEICFFAWAAGQVGYMGPCLRGRGNEAKVQLLRAAIGAIAAIRAEILQARFVQVEPLIHIVSDDDAAQEERRAAQAHCQAQFESWDVISGQRCPELGGRPEYLDILGCNYYVHNQWVWKGPEGGPMLQMDDPRYRPLSKLLGEVWQRYRRPLFISETGIEDERRPGWFRYVCSEVTAALSRDIPVEGICLYPIVNHPGWDDERHCHNGLWDYCNNSGEREIYSPLAFEILRQQPRLKATSQRCYRRLQDSECGATA